MSLGHDFLLLDLETDGEGELTRFINDPRAVHLQDDLIRYMGDSLAWVPTYNPDRHEPHSGLCLWGTTIIDTQGAATAERVFRGWADLFSLSPSVLVLTGNFSWAAGEDTPPSEGERITQLDGGYDRLHFDRDVVVGVLKQLAQYAERVRLAGGRLYLLHQGV